MFLFLLPILIIFQLDFVFLDCLVTRNYARFRRSNVVAAASVPKLRTVGGDEVDREEAFPFMVSIMKRGRLIGGGVILERHWILSAAHLFIDKGGTKPKDYSIGYGSIQLSSQRHASISTIFLHSFFSNHTLTDDIALLRTRDPLLYRNQTGVIYLPHPPKRLPKHPNDLTILGWGDIALETTNLNGILKVGAMKSISSKVCSRFFKNQVGKIQKQVCLFSKEPSKKRTSTCQGDSGGPAFEILDGKAVLIGISSWTDHRCSPDYPSVFTRVSFYLEFICQTVKQFEEQLKSKQQSKSSW